MKRILTYIFCIYPIASSPQVVFQKTYGGASNDYFQDIKQALDGGYVLLGSTQSFGAGMTDMYMVKTDADGNISWSKSFGKTNFDYGRCLQLTSDKGYIIAGSYHNGTTSDIYIVKTDSDGIYQWARNYGGALSDYGYSISQTFYDGFITAGYTSSYGAGNTDVYLVKMDKTGNVEWRKTFGGSNYDEGQSVVQVMDKGFLVAGYTSSYGAGGKDVYVLKTDSNGTLKWSKTFGGTGDDEAKSARLASDGGFIISGYTKSYGAGGMDVLLLKLSSNGTLQWAKTFGGTGDETAQGAMEAPGGEYYVNGYTNSFGAGAFDICFLKIKSNGVMQWSKTYGGSNNDYGQNISPASDGTFLLANHSQSFGSGNFDLLLIKADTGGTSGCNQSGAATVSGTPSLTVSSGGLSGTGGVPGSMTPILNDPVTTDSILCYSIAIDEISSGKISFTIYPNPFSRKVNLEIKGAGEIKNISFELYDLYGRKVFSSEVINCSIKGEHTPGGNIEMNLPDNLTGIYFYKISLNGNRFQSGKLVAG